MKRILCKSDNREDYERNGRKGRATSATSRSTSSFGSKSTSPKSQTRAVRTSRVEARAASDSRKLSESGIYSRTSRGGHELKLEEEVKKVEDPRLSFVIKVQSEIGTWYPKEGGGYAQVWKVKQFRSRK